MLAAHTTAWTRRPSTRVSNLRSLEILIHSRLSPGGVVPAEDPNHPLILVDHR
jgi:hypothetical protein